MKSNNHVVEELVFERSEIKMRSVHLERFMKEHGAGVPKRQYSAMVDQHKAMREYVNALSTRIDDLIGETND